MKKLFMILSALFVCHAMQAQYFCTTPNTELHYVNYDGAGQSVSNVTASVQNIEQKNGEVIADYLCKIVTNKAKGNTSYSLIRWTCDGDKTICEEDLLYGVYIDKDMDPSKYDAAARMKMMDELKYKGDNTFTLVDGSQAGTALPDRYYKLLDGLVKKEYTISGGSYMGRETVSTTGGKYNCIKISYLKRTKVVLKKTDQRIVEWYAKGVGLVKSETYNMKGDLDGKTLLVKVVHN